MRVLYIMNHADTGGSALAFKEIVLTMKKRHNVEPIVITGRNNTLNEFFEDKGIENFSFSFKNFISSYHNPEFIYKKLLYIRHLLGNMIAIKKIIKNVDLEHIDLIETNLDRIDIGAILSKKYHIPHIWHIREHLGSDFNVTSIFSNYINYMNSFSSTYVAVSKSVKDTWVSRGINPRNINIIYDGVNIDDIKKKEKFRNNKLNLLFLGGYYEHKGQFSFIQLLNELPRDVKDKITITFYGNGDAQYRKILEKYVEKTKLSTFIKLKTYDPQIYDHIRDYDVGVNFSDKECFGRVTVEYMAAGLPVICSNTGANKELIQDTKNGFRIEKGNSEKLCKALVSLMDVQIRKNIKVTNIEKAKKFSNKNNSDYLYQLYKQVLKNGC